LPLSREAPRDGEFNHVEIWTGVTRSVFDDRLELTLYNYWSPEYSGETGQNNVIELTSVWTSRFGISRRNSAASSAANGAISAKAATITAIEVSP
jgi:hypothetical protein